MESGFQYARKVFFYETDLAGVVHFSNYFRYMEEAEHALWRASGMAIDRAGGDVGWPRVAATFDYKAPLFYEDELVVLVRVDTVTRRSIKYAFTFTRNGTTIGTGSLTTACVNRPSGAMTESMKAIDITPEIVARLRAATGQT